MANKNDTPMMIAQLDRAFWDQLLDRIELQKVIPVVGSGAITFGPGDDLLHPWLAQKVAVKCHLRFPAADLPKTLQQVVDEQRRGGATHEEKRERLAMVHLYVFNLLYGFDMQPGVTLYRLASIKDFQLFLTTSFDPLLAKAVEVVQPGSRPVDWVRAISLRDGFKDLPAVPGDLPYACVYHLLGKIRRAPDCALWDDETLAFLRELDYHLRASGYLSAALHDSHLLFLGLTFDNWLLRFLVQVVKGKHLSELNRDQLYLSESQEAAERDQVVVFFSRLTHQFRLIQTPPCEFIAELARRWRKRHPPNPDGVPAMKQAHRLAHRSAGCIFVSYASPDLPIAKYIVKQLQDKGLLVWFDKQQILPGQVWEAEFSEIVEDTCGIFLSLISDTSAQRLTAYNILERNLASKRRDRFVDSEVFYIPLRIDEGEPLVPANEPRGVKKIHADRKPGGHLDDDFIEYLRQLQLEYIRRCGLTFTPPPPAP
jgi:hypothetical protein